MLELYEGLMLGFVWETQLKPVLFNQQGSKSGYLLTMTRFIFRMRYSFLVAFGITIHIPCGHR